MDNQNARIMGILIRPKYPQNDCVAGKLYFWAEELFSHIKREQVIDLTCDNAVRKTFENDLDKYPEIPILFYGHGRVTGDSLVGYYDENIVDTNNNHLLAKRKILSIACHSLLNLGKDCINKEASGYIGYKKQLLVPRVDDKIIQNSFSMPNNSGALKLLNNNCSVKAIYEDMIEKYENEINNLKGLNMKYQFFMLFLNDNMDQLGYETG